MSRNQGRRPVKKSPAKSGGFFSSLVRMGFRLGVIAMLIGLVVGAGMFMTSKSNAEASSAKVKQKASETVEAATDYAKETKQDFQKRMEKNLSEIESDIADLRSQAAKATDDTRSKIDAQVKELEVKRTELRTQLAKMQDSSDRAWTKMRVGMEKAWADLKTAYGDAKNELSSEKSSKAEKK